jgi:hypothetical protein
MQPQPINPPPRPCPVCGAEPPYQIWSNFVHQQYAHISSKKHSMMGSQLAPLVCTICGYVQLFVNPEDFRD